MEMQCGHCAQVMPLLLCRRVLEAQFVDAEAALNTMIVTLLPYKHASHPQPRFY